MTQGLKLNIYGKCDDEKGEICTCANRPPGLRAEKEVNKPVNGFTKYIHGVPNGKAFTLQRDVGNGDQIRGGTGKSIEGVKEASVYYWNGKDTEPILIEIKDGNDKLTYYGKAYNSKNWMTGRVLNMTELQALDNQNCHNNAAVPFNIQDSTSGDFLKNDKVTCVKTIRKINSTPSQNPPGSNYITTAYSVSGHDTKISRVTYKEKDTTDLTPPTYPVGVIRLYSYLGSGKVPIMVEFRSHSGNSRWFHSKNATIQGTEWQEIYDGGNTFYDGGTIPRLALSEKLDEVLCSQYRNVTLNLTRTHSERHATGGDKNKYCCNEHKNERKISVVPVPVSCRNLSHISSHTTAYKHTIVGGYNIAGIYYLNDGGKRENLSGLRFPMDGVDNVYSFYCQGEEPSLIYVDSGNPAARGWYKNSNGQWTWILQLSGIKSTHIETGLTCVKWNEFKKYLKGYRCNDLSDCSYSSDGEQIQAEEKQLKEEAEKEKLAREKALQQKQQQPASAPVEPGSSGSDSITSSSQGSLQPGTASYSVPAVEMDQEKSKTAKIDTKATAGNSGAGIESPSARTQTSGKGGTSFGNSLSSFFSDLGDVVLGVIKTAESVGALLTTSLPKSQEKSGSSEVQKNGDISTEHEQLNADQDTNPGRSITIPGGGFGRGGQTTPAPAPKLSQENTDNSLYSEQKTAIPVPGSEALQKPVSSNLASTQGGGTQSEGDGREDSAPPQTTTSPEVKSEPALEETPGSQNTADMSEPHSPQAKPVALTATPADTAEDTSGGSPQPVVGLLTSGSALAGYIVPSVFGGAGSLTGFGWWVYKRSKGDPWVRHGCSIAFKKCTILSMHRLFSGFLFPSKHSFIHTDHSAHTS